MNTVKDSPEYKNKKRVLLLYTYKTGVGLQWVIAFKNVTRLHLEIFCDLCNIADKRIKFHHKLKTL